MAGNEQSYTSAEVINTVIEARMHQRDKFLEQARFHAARALDLRERAAIQQRKIDEALERLKA